MKKTHSGEVQRVGRTLIAFVFQNCSWKLPSLLEGKLPMLPTKLLWTYIIQPDCWALNHTWQCWLWSSREWLQLLHFRCRTLPDAVYTHEVDKLIQCTSKSVWKWLPWEDSLKPKTELNYLDWTEIPEQEVPWLEAILEAVNRYCLADVCSAWGALTM